MRLSHVLRALALVGCASILVPAVASAHERRTVGKYELVVGFFVEPVYVGQMNGVSLRVQLPGAPATPVEGLEKTLQVEITHMGSGTRKTVPLRTVFREPGHYTADLLPTVTGQYRFRFFGTIEGTTVNEQFTSGANFDSVEGAGEIEFPERVAQVREVQGLASAARDQADDADSAASTARLLAIAALAVAVLSGGPALALTLRWR
ncbi:MAG: hypothetical protein EXR63_05550 [Dehalococcoidia bacterium]|nr:hypothetical protein [Dehalococcoidia bacterium]